MLLLEQLLKYTWKEHCDYDDIAKAVEKLQEVVSHVNEAIRDAQRMNQLLDIEQKFSFTLVRC